MKKYFSFLTFLSLFLIPTETRAQVAQVLKEGTITTAGASCSSNSVPPDTNCLFVISLIDVPSVGLYVDVGTSGTINFEFSQNDPTDTAPTWRAMADDLTAATSTTADGSFFFSNPGYRQIRVRASAISGPTQIKFIRGYASMKTTASLTGSGGDGAIVDGVSSAIKATVNNYTNSKPLSVTTVDTNGTYVTSGGTITTFPDNEPFNLAQLGGSAITTGSGSSGPGVFRTIEANDSLLTSALGATSDNAAAVGSTGSINAKLRTLSQQIQAQACSDSSSVTTLPISTTASVELKAFSGSTFLYICGLNVTSAADVNVQFLFGNGTVCASSPTNATGLYSLTAASGAGIRGMTLGFGNGVVLKSGSGQSFCITLSAAVQVSGVFSYVQR